MSHKRISFIIVLAVLVTVLTASSAFAWVRCGWYRIPNSHQPGADWCPDGWVITALDLDGCGYGNMHAMGDCPIIGQAKCCQPRSNLANYTGQDSDQQTISADVVEGGVIVAGDIIFQKDQEKLWRMFEDENGLYVENMKTGKTYRLILQEIGGE
ncbi:MAG: hypothetical protein HGJ94_20125 [Desulfosarcina sp.]|nr:hypothetical protein [Desulfosarcina sp.]MBC2744550.1 hypothetical protein [Desulfosarcina sp.]MBC2767460.1 hypothetical protein [Desulfosarcina sp.]